jgi:hypothetical protein
MPFITSDQDLLKQQQAQGQGTDPSAPQSVSQGASGVITGSASGTGSQAGASDKPASSGAYTNLQDYLNANKDNAATLGQNVGNNIRQAGNDASNAINDSSNQFSQQVGQGTIKNLDAASQDASNIVSNARNTTAGQSLSANDLGRFKDVSTAQYSGPNNWQSANVYQPAFDKVQNVQNESNLLSTDSGRYALLQKFFNRPDYTSGQTNLDGLLLNGNQEGRDALASARNDVSGIGNQFQSAQDTGAALAAQTKAQTDQVRNDALSGFNTNRDQENTAVQNRLGDIQSHWADEYNQYKNLLGGYKGGELNLNQAQADKLGISNDSRIYQMLNGTDPSAYLKQNAFDASKEVNSNEQAQLAALDQLAQQAGLAQTNKYTDASLAGTQSLADALDASGFGSAQAGRQTQFDNYAKGANFNAVGDASRDIMVSGGLLGSHRLGQADAEARGSQNLSQYLSHANPNVSDSGTYNIDPLSLIGTGGVATQLFDGGPQGEANQAAHNLMIQSLQAQLSNALASNGFGNQVKIK